MVNSDTKHRLDEDDRSSLMPALSTPLNYPASLSQNGAQAAAAIEPGVANVGAYTLMVAGQRTGKTSFLRLLLDTSDISPSTTKDQLASVAKFVQGCSGHTSNIRTASIDVELDTLGNGVLQRLGLTLVDTPSLDFQDEASAERLVLEILRHVDSRLAEGIEDEWKARSGDHHVHLCIYFLDPDQIVPPCVPGPPAPLVSRTHAASFSQPELEPVILEPPVTTNPSLCRPTLPASEITTIRRLSARVNVLPVVARADTLTNDRLAAVKNAIRRDLAEAGIGFGIFDMDSHAQYPTHLDSASLPSGSSNGDPSNGYGTHVSGPPSSAASTSSPVSPPASPLPRLPYALISPDIYSHSDGVPRVLPPRHELALQYTPSNRQTTPPKLAKGKFVRNYRWGSMDVLDPAHSDFLPLRNAIFHHMETLQKYTREYLFQKFRVDYQQQQQQQSLSHHMSSGMSTHSHAPSLTHVARPILAIDTAQHGPMRRPPSLSSARNMNLGPDMRSGPIIRTAQDTSSSNMSVKSSGPGARSSRQRTKKITVACNFCRSRKLKCDGLQPCTQCQKRSHPCDYMAQNKRRGTLRQRRAGEDSDSDGEVASGEDRSADADEPSVSPEVPSQPLSRRSSNVGRLPAESDTFSSVSGGLTESYTHPPPLPPVRTKPHASLSPAESRSMFRDTELPHIATLSLPDTSATSMDAPLPPIRPVSDHSTQRKRASTVPGKATRNASTSGPKIVACNFCRARKTKCDGAHPACSSCVRRSLACTYIHDAAANNGPSQRKASRRASASVKGRSPSPHSPQLQSSSSHTGHLVRPHSDAESMYGRRDHSHEDSDIDLKRSFEDDSDMPHSQKKMRLDGPSLMIASIR